MRSTYVSFAAEPLTQSAVRYSIVEYRKYKAALCKTQAASAVIQSSKCSEIPVILYIETVVVGETPQDDDSFI